MLVDDIDNIFNTKNTALIDKDMLFIQNEAFGSLANYAKIVVLGNIIRMDGRNVRIRETYKTNPQRKVFSSFLY
ncbi:MAG: hypothetical protein LBG52_04255 [Candidatus Peribacteria bacterium]|nr:hypothetical protein [Candidatus Peribacteria bacterium]